MYVTKRRFGDAKKLEALRRVHELGINILPIPDSMVFKAAEIKAEYPIFFADCFALVCALEHSAILLTGDPEFKNVSHLINIQWIR